MYPLSAFRFKVSSSSEADDSARYFAVPKHFEDLDIHPISPTYINIHIGVVDSCWDHTSGKT